MMLNSISGLDDYKNEDDLKYKDFNLKMKSTCLHEVIHTFLTYYALLSLSVLSICSEKVLELI